jgi:DNA-binding CsgD family transcriptional regulator
MRRSNDVYCSGKCDAVIKLSPREREVLALYIAKGRLMLVTEVLGRSVHTVRTQKNNIMWKLGATTSAGLIRTAIQKGLVKP